MKTKKEIEKLATNKYGTSIYSIDEVEAFKEGYTQCQEDMAKILFNISKLVNEREYTEHSRLTDIKDFINSLNKQD